MKRKKDKYSRKRAFLILHIAFCMEKDKRTKLAIAFEIMKFDLNMILRNGEEYAKYYMNALTYAVLQGKDVWQKWGCSEKLYQDALNSVKILTKAVK